MTTLAALQSLVAQGESETLELKRSTAELRRQRYQTTAEGKRLLGREIQASSGGKNDR